MQALAFGLFMVLAMVLTSNHVFSFRSALSLGFAIASAWGWLAIRWVDRRGDWAEP